MADTKQLTTVTQQLKDYCECIKGLDEDDEKLEKNVNELIWLISQQTCWSRQPCETFLYMERTEYMDVEDINRCTCNGCIVDFEPYYYPFTPESIKVELIIIDGITEKKLQIGEDDIGYISSDDTYKIRICDYLEVTDICQCPVDYRLKITYDAGYEYIPDCLLKFFCDALHIIYLMNTCNCETCQACNDSFTDVEMKFEESDNLGPQIKNYLTQLMLNAYMSQIGLISLCGKDMKFSKVWGIMV